MARLGYERKQSANRKFQAKEQQSRSTAGGRLLRELPAVLVQALEDWMASTKGSPGVRHRALEILENVNLRVIASLSLEIVIDSLSAGRTYTRTALMIANRIEDEECYKAFHAQSPGSLHAAIGRSSDFTDYAQKRRHILRAMTLFGYEKPKWDDHLKTAVGVTILELIVQHCGIADSITVRRGRRSETKIVATEECLRWMEDENERIAQMSPMYLPFLEEPLDWVDPMSGGFHSTNVWSTSIIKTSDVRYLEDLQAAKMPAVYSAVNSLQRTRWKLNQDVFQTFSYLWEAGYTKAGLPLREDEELPPKPAGFEDSKEIRREWSQRARAIHDKNNRRKSDRLTMGRLHWVCKRYEDQPFYFCHQLDWRGRAYPISYYLQPQGPDLVKALLGFADGKRVDTPEALMWHRIHGSNCWGNDKLPFEGRLQWVLDNEAKIRRIAEDPLTYPDWEEADKPWQFLAWACDYVAVLDDPTYESCLPIHQDATQSGIQIYSLLLRDRGGAEATNCVPHDEPQDLYGLVANRLVAALMDKHADGHSLATAWLEFGVDRSCCKRPVMTRVYNATKHSSATYVQQWAEAKAQAEDIPPPEGGHAKAYWYLTKLLWEAMELVISSTERCQSWLSDAARLFAEDGKEIHWKTPLGLPIVQRYPNWRRFCVRTRINQVYRQTSLRRDTGQINRRKMVSAFAPNVIHSLDATAMMMTVNEAAKAGITSITCNHDSFATLAADSQKLAEATRRAYVELFSQDLLQDFRAQLQAQLPDEVVPEVPEYGDLDVRELERSLYFFS